jgi:hypothetical protein
MVGRIAIESKAGAQASEAVVLISSEHQLDTSKIEKMFLHFAVFRPALPEEAGSFSVSDVAARIRDRLLDAGESVVTRYDALLTAAGLSDDDDYAEIRWTGGERGIYRVDHDFPRVTPPTIASSITHVRYALDLSECGQYLVTASMLEAAIRGMSDVGA